MDHLKMIIKLMIVITTVILTEATTPKYTQYEDNVAQESVQQPKIEKPIVNSALPNSIFNNGQAFYGERDPVSGQINFNAKKSADIGQFNDELLINDKASEIKGVSSNDISQIPSNFHDYLHLPVKYTSSKFVQPLVSSSYSNLKYQGNNKNFTSNHKNYTTTTERPTTLSSTLSGFKHNNNGPHNGGSTYYTLKPRPITNSPLHVFTTKTPPKTTNYYEYYKGKLTMKPVPVTIPSTVTEPTPTTTTIKATTTSKTTTSTTTTTTTPRPQPTTTTLASTKTPIGTPVVFPNAAPSEFKPVSVNPPTATSIPSTTPHPTKRPLTLSDILNSLDGDNSVNTIEHGKTEVQEITVSVPSQPNTISSGFTIPKLPQVPHRFESNGQKPEQTLQQHLANQHAGQPQNGQHLPHQQMQQHSANHQTGQSQNGQQLALHQFQQHLANHQIGYPQNGQQSVHQQQQLHSGNHQTGQPQNGQPLQQHLGSHQIEQPQHGQQSHHHQQQQNLASHQTTQSQNGQQAPLQQLHSATSSMNNIIISPDQDSASFVLGSHQSFGETTDGHYVGSASQDKPVVHHEKPSHFQFGTIINENNFAPEFKPQGFTSKEETKPENKITSSIRFPNENPSFDNSQIVTGPIKHELNIPTLALPQSQIVVFPPNEKMPTEIVNAELENIKKPEENRVVFKNDKEILSMNSQPTYHQLPENLTPPHPNNINGYQQYNYNRMPPPPPQFALNMLNKKPAGNRIPDRSLPNILPQFRPNTRIDHQPYHQVQFMKKPTLPMQSPYKHNLPPYMTGERLPLNRNSEKPLMPVLNNRQGINPHGFTNKMAPALIQPDTAESNRRVYRVPSPMYEPPVNRLYGPPIPQLPPNRYMQERPKMPLPPPQPHMVQGPPPQMNHKPQFEQNYPPPMPAHHHHQVAPFESDDFYQRPPVLRHPAYTPPAENQNNPDQQQQQQLQQQHQLTQMEPVVTLQMIQSKKNHQQQPQLPNKSIDTRVTTQPQQANNANPILNEVNNGQGKNPVYVVYPIKSAPMKLNVIGSDAEDSVVIGQRGDQPPLPPSQIAGFETKNDYQNTPFTIVRNEQQPILMAKDKSNQKLRVHFPYNLEKPDPLTVAELDRQSHIKKGQLNDFEVFNTGEAPLDALPKVINKGKPQDIIVDDFEDENDDYLFGKGTRRPIAIAYTPTEPPTYYANTDRFSHPNYDGPVISEIIDEDGEDEKYPAYNKDDIDELGYPSRGENYEADFQAPFYPSVSLGGSVVKNDYEGWSVIVPSTTLPTISYASPSSPAATPSTSQQNAQALAQHQKNQINRSDNNESDEVKHERNETPEVTTRKFDPDSFKPQFESGFKPIIGSPILRTPITTEHQNSPDTSSSTMMKTTTTPNTMGGNHKQSTTETPSTISTSLKQVVSSNVDKSTNSRPKEENNKPATEVTTKKSVFESSIEALFGLSDDDYDENTARNL